MHSQKDVCYWMMLLAESATLMDAESATLMDRAQKALDAAERQTVSKASSASNGKHSSHGTASSRSGSAKVRATAPAQNIHRRSGSRGFVRGNPPSAHVRDNVPAHILQHICINPKP